MVVAMWADSCLSCRRICLSGLSPWRSTVPRTVPVRRAGSFGRSLVRILSGPKTRRRSQAPSPLTTLQDVFFPKGSRGTRRIRLLFLVGALLVYHRAYRAWALVRARHDRYEPFRTLLGLSTPLARSISRDRNYSNERFPFTTDACHQ